MPGIARRGRTGEREAGRSHLDIVAGRNADHRRGRQDRWH